MTHEAVKPTTIIKGVSDNLTALPKRRGLVIALSLLVGFVLTVVWSAAFVDDVIGQNVADTLLGRDAEAPIGGILVGVAFAFVSGLAGTFTACNIAAFGAMAPVLGESSSGRSRLKATLRPLGWLAVGMIAVSASYGAIVGIVGTGMPQFVESSGSGDDLSPRLVQAMVVFGIVGAAFLYLGFAALRIVPDPFARISSRFPYARLLVIGMLIGGFLIGRPFSLFRNLFRYAAETHNVLFGAFAFVLQSVGNITLMAVIVILLSYRPGAGLRRWLGARPGRVVLVTAAGLLVVGAFTLLYWDVRILARRELIWYPLAPWT